MTPAEYQREWRRKNPGMARNNELKKNHRITLDDYNQILDEQGGVCAVCGIAPGQVGTGRNTKGTLAVDHCHTTGAFRGLLCTNCNLGLGSFFENTDLLRRAAAYLQEHQELVSKLLARKVQLAAKHLELADTCLEELANGP